MINFFAEALLETWEQRYYYMAQYQDALHYHGIALNISKEEGSEARPRQNGLTGWEINCSLF